MTDRQITHAPGCWSWGPAHYGCAVREIERLRDAPAQQPAAVDVLAARLVDELDGLVGESYGVSGLHLNGDVAPWDELLPGGRFERLSSLDELRAALAAQPATHPDDAAVDRFAAAMKAKLAKKRTEGRGGWDDKAQCTGEFLSALLREHVDKGDPLDVGNLAMMLHQRGERISAQPAASAEPREVDMDEYRAMVAAMEQIDPATLPGLTAAQQRIACLPADWREDSSLETWFPFTAKQLAALQAENEWLRAEVETWKTYARGKDDLWQESVRRAERLAEAVRGLEEREQRDEALLRQALETLSRAHQTAMEQTLKARIPECAEFAGIAQDLDFVVAALRERLGEGAEP